MNISADREWSPGAHSIPMDTELILNNTFKISAKHERRQKATFIFNDRGRGGGFYARKYYIKKTYVQHVSSHYALYIYYIHRNVIFFGNLLKSICVFLSSLLKHLTSLKRKVILLRFFFFSLFPTNAAAPLRNNEKLGHSF